MELAAIKNKFSKLYTFTLMWSLTTLGSFIFSLFLIEIGDKSDVRVLDVAIGGFAIALPQSYLLRQKILPLSWMISTVLGWVLITTIGVGAVGWFVLSTELFYFRIFFGIISGGIGGIVI